MRHHPAILELLEQSEQQTAGADRWHQEQQGGRIFGQREEAHDRARRIFRNEPRLVAIDIEIADQHEAQHQPKASHGQAPDAPLRIAALGEPRPAGIAQQDDADPWQDGIGGLDRDAAKFNQRALMQDRPGDIARLIGRQPDRVEQIVQADDGQAHRKLRDARQVQQGGQRDHRNPDGPDDLQPNRRRREGGGLGWPGIADHGKFQDNQEKPALQQKFRHLPLAVRLAIEPGRQTGERDKSRRAKGRQQAGVEQPRIGRVRVHRVGDLHVEEECLAHMIDQHEQHDQAAQRVDRDQAGTRLGCGHGRRGAGAEGGGGRVAR